MTRLERRDSDSLRDVAVPPLKNWEAGIIETEPISVARVCMESLVLFELVKCDFCYH